MLASKGVDTEKMWKDVARSLDDIDLISKSLNEKLKLKVERTPTSYRVLDGTPE